MSKYVSSVAAILVSLTFSSVALAEIVTGPVSSRPGVGAPGKSDAGGNNGKGTVAGHSNGRGGGNGGVGGLFAGGGGGGGGSIGVPGPIAGAGLPFILVAGGYAWYRKRRSARA